MRELKESGRINLKSLAKNFPNRLLKVVNDNVLIRWTNDGLGVIIDEREFEENVMKLYPGFVQIASFHNLRRLFRDYGFRYKLLRRRKPFGIKIEYRHPAFSKYVTPEELQQIQKKKRVRHNYICPLATSSPNIDNLNYKQKKKTQYFCTKLPLDSSYNCLGFDVYKPNRKRPSCSDKSCMDLSQVISPVGLQYGGFNSDMSVSISSNVVSPHDFQSPVRSKLGSLNRSPRRGTFSLCLMKRFIPEGVDNVNARPSIPEKLEREDILKLLQTYARNELNEDQCWEIFTRQCKDINGINTWEETLTVLDMVANHELSPLRSKTCSFCELSIDEL